jgi:hypothetical protein
MFWEAFQLECESLRALAFKEIKSYYILYVCVLQPPFLGKFNFDEIKAFSSLILKNREYSFQMWRKIGSWC